MKDTTLTIEEMKQLNKEWLEIQERNETTHNPLDIKRAHEIYKIFLDATTEVKSKLRLVR